MVRYKMLARDINSNPTQYRTWIVADNPDFGAEFYSGYKSGPNQFVDVTAYTINDGYVIADFNLPLGSQWSPVPSEFVADFPIRKVLPEPIEDSQLAIIDGYAYMFGGKVTDKIYYAHLNNPADWFDTGARLPTPLYAASMAIVDGYIYLFGGNSGNETEMGTGAVDTIFSAPVSNPLHWTNHGSLLPRKLHYSNLGMVNGNLYLFGGREINNASNVIFHAPTSNPLAWTDTGLRLPVATYGSIFTQLDGYWFMYGGLLFPDTPTNVIWRSPITNPAGGTFDGYLPYATAHGQFVTMGSDGYLIGPMVGSPSNFTPILQCYLSNPAGFFDTRQVVRGVISHSQLAIIYDRIWLFGGSGETAVFACNQKLKYDYYNHIVQNYAHTTRVAFPASDNLNNPWLVLGIPYWQTDYSMSLPPAAPSVPPAPPPPPGPPFPPTTKPPPYL